MKQNNNKTIISSCKGAALIIALLVITSMSAIGFFISRLNIKDIVMMSRLEDSMISYFAAEAGIEQGVLMWRYNNNVETRSLATESQGDYREFNIDEARKYKLKIWHRVDTSETGDLKQDETREYDISGINDLTLSWKKSNDETGDLVFGSDFLEFTVTANDNTIGTSEGSKWLLDTNTLSRNIDTTNAKKIRFHSWGPKMKEYTLSTSDSDFKLDSKFTYIESIGIYGNSQRKLRIKIDRQSGATLPVFDFVIYGNQGINN